MTTKEKIMIKLHSLDEQEPILEQILDILEAQTGGKRETTPNGRIIRTREDLMKMERCPYPPEDDL